MASVDVADAADWRNKCMMDDNYDGYCDPEISKDFLIGFYDAISAFEVQMMSGDGFNQALLTVMANGCSLDKSYTYRLGFSDAEMKLNIIGRSTKEALLN